MVDFSNKLTIKKEYVYHDPKELFKRSLIRKWGHIPYNPELKERARELRKNMTPVEKKLWQLFLKHRPENILRQKPIDNYIADFYIPSIGIVIELDGKSHDHRQEYDKIRTEILEQYDIKVIRYKNEQIYNDNEFEFICDELEKIFKERKNTPLCKITPSPSLPKRGTATAKEEKT